jgi:hypothetical protein
MRRLLIHPRFFGQPLERNRCTNQVVQQGQSFRRFAVQQSGNGFFESRLAKRRIALQFRLISRCSKLFQCGKSKVETEQRRINSQKKAFRRLFFLTEPRT